MKREAREAIEQSFRQISEHIEKVFRDLLDLVNERDKRIQLLVVEHVGLRRHCDALEGRVPDGDYELSIQKEADAMEQGAPYYSIRKVTDCYYLCENEKNAEGIWIHAPVHRLAPGFRLAMLTFAIETAQE